MVDRIISTAREVISLDEPSLRNMLLNNDPQLPVLDKFKQEMAKAILDSSHYKLLVTRVIKANNSSEVEQLVRGQIQSNSNNAPSIILLGQAVKFKLKRNLACHVD